MILNKEIPCKFYYEIPLVKSWWKVLEKVDGAKRRKKCAEEEIKSRIESLQNVSGAVVLPAYKDSDSYDGTYNHILIINSNIQIEHIVRSTGITRRIFLHKVSNKDTPDYIV